MYQPHPEDLIDAYLAGELSPDAAADVRAYLETRPGRRGVIEGIHAAIYNLDLGAPPAASSLRPEFMRQLDAATMAGPAMPKEKVNGLASVSGPLRRAKVFGWSSGAQGGPLGKQTLHMGHLSKKWALRRSLSLSAFAAVSAAGVWIVMQSSWHGSSERIRDYVAASGQQRVITLADSTQIRLAPGSRLHVVSEFNRTSRQVALTGEALFRVHASPVTPFTVRTGRVVTTVLGTTFAIRARAGEPIGIDVQEGRVSVENPRSAIVLAAGTAAQVTDSTVTQTTAHEPTQYTDWTQGQLVFNRAPVPDVLATVGQWYGYRFQLMDSVLAKRNLSVSFKMADPAEMMAILKDVLDADLRFDGTTVTVVRRTDRRIDATRHSWHQQFTPSVEMGK